MLTRELLGRQFEPHSRTDVVLTPGRHIPIETGFIFCGFFGLFGLHRTLRFFVAELEGKTALDISTRAIGHPERCCLFACYDEFGLLEPDFNYTN